MRELVLRIVRGLADSPNQAQVEQSEQNGLVHLRLIVADSDKGKIIGKQGKVIKAIRCVAAAAGTKAGKRVSVEIE